MILDDLIIRDVLNSLYHLLRKRCHDRCVVAHNLLRLQIDPLMCGIVAPAVIANLNVYCQFTSQCDN